MKPEQFPEASPTDRHKSIALSEPALSFDEFAAARSGCGAARSSPGWSGWSARTTSAATTAMALMAGRPGIAIGT